MARVKLSEYRAKKIILGDEYPGVQVRTEKKTKLPSKGQFVAKVDQGVKKRFKHGLVAVNVTPTEAQKKFSEWNTKGFTQFLLEPIVPHEASEERYLSLERVREGIRVLYARDGGIDIESHPESVQSFVIHNEKDIEKVAGGTQIPTNFLRSLLDAFNDAYFAFLEINPLIVRGEDVFVLDAAVLVDNAAQFFTRAWSEDDLVKTVAKNPHERAVEVLQQTTPASLKLSVLNEHGSIFFLLSGGGGSIVIADAVATRGKAKEIGNYGEYSGGPSREETYLYAKEVLALLLESKSKRKSLVIAGGVANFTDVGKTFAGIIDALSEQAPALRKSGVKVFVRRGGPGEAEGLAHMRAFLEQEGLLGTIAGSDTPITSAVEEALTEV